MGLKDQAAYSHWDTYNAANRTGAFGVPETCFGRGSKRRSPPQSRRPASSGTPGQKHATAHSSTAKHGDGGDTGDSGDAQGAYEGSRRVAAPSTTTYADQYTALLMGQL